MGLRPTLWGAVPPPPLSTGGGAVQDGDHPPSPLPFQILGIIFACCLMKGIRSGYEVM